MSLIAGRATLLALLLFACAPIRFATPSCSEAAIAVPLPAELHESSGVAVSRQASDIFWTHNDGGSVLTAIDRTGTLLRNYPVRPSLGDWEDIGVGECEVAPSCLYLADVGDNAERRAPGSVRILRIAEPRMPFTGDAPDVLVADVFPIRLPDGPRDIEALLVFPGEQLYVVTKGRNHPVAVYRYPLPLRSDTVTLETVQELTDSAPSLADWVTGGSVGPDGLIAGLRSYQALRFYRLEADTLASLDDGFVNLRTLREAQGEAVGIGRDGLVVLTSEAGPFGGAPSMNILRCEFGA